jgi:Xaa-Pro aminopeptidase
MTEFSEEEMSKELQDKVRALPREIAPPEGAWNAIRAEIEKPRIHSMPATLPHSQRFWQRPALLAAAGLLLVAGSSLVTMTVDRNREVPGQAVATRNPAASNSDAGPSTFAEFASVENDYISSVNQLSAVLESERSTLSPGTVAKLRKSLEIIDAAILEARRALAADPANKAIVDMLNTSYNQKLDLLRRTTEMGRT